MALPDLSQFWPILEKVLFIVVILLATAVTAELAKKITEKTLKTNFPTLTLYVQRYLSFFIWILGVVFAMGQLGLSIEILLLTLFLLGLALIVGLKDVLENIASRPFLDLYSSYKLGDLIEIEGKIGKVIEINAINTSFLTKNRELVIVPNSLFLKKILINKSSQAGEEITISVLLDREMDEVEFEKGLIGIFNEMKGYLKRTETPTVVTTKTTSDLKELSILVAIKNPEDRDVVKSKLNERIKKLIEEIREKGT
ncbi:MAG: mechanosensitive ion channel family protein [Candidatus Methanofastidiosia archaeon]